MKNKLALCSRGQLGLITENEKQAVTMVDHSVHMAYVGIHLTDGPGHRIGQPWSSRKPIVVGELVSMASGHCVRGFGFGVAWLQQSHSA